MRSAAENARRVIRPWSTPGKTEVSKSDAKNVVSHRCKYSEDTDMLIRHSMPAGAARSTQIWVFSRDFPEQDEQAAHSPRSMLHAKLGE